jgi:hypothetical protein
MPAHTQDAVVVYVTRDEKREIKRCAKVAKKSMSRYLLDLHLSHEQKNWKGINE